MTETYACDPEQVRGVEGEQKESVSIIQISVEELPLCV